MNYYRELNGVALVAKITCASVWAGVGKKAKTDAEGPVGRLLLLRGER